MESQSLDGVSAFSQIKVKTEKREKVKLNAMLMQDGKKLCIERDTWPFSYKFASRAKKCVVDS